MNLEKYLGRSRLGRLVVELTHRFFDHNVGNSAAALTYYLIFAFFPFLIFVSSLLGMLQLPQMPVEELRAFIPQDILELIGSFLGHVQQTSSTPMLIFGLVFAIYFPARAMWSMTDFLAIAYDVREHRSVVRRSLVVMLLAIGMVVTMASSFAILLLGKGLLSWASTFLPISLEGIALWNIIRFVLLGAMLFVMLTLLYLLAPGCVVSLRSVLPGALGSLVCWLIYTVGFSFYVENLASYSVVYGSIGAIIVLLIWLYATSMTLIMGAELNAALWKRKY